MDVGIQRSCYAIEPPKRDVVVSAEKVVELSAGDAREVGELVDRDSSPPCMGADVVRDSSLQVAGHRPRVWFVLTLVGPTC